MLSNFAGDEPSNGGTPRKGMSQAVRAKGAVSTTDEDKDRATRNAGIISIPRGGGRAGSGDS
jgi:hypothetical protein